MPWIMLAPSTWLSPAMGIAMIILNGLILYLLFGGLRRARGKH
jgi:hypothetical protein